jgi:hypothetical protein
MNVDFMSGFPLMDDLAKNAQAERLCALRRRLKVVWMRKEDAARSTTRAAGSRLCGLVNQLRVAIHAAHLFLFSHEPRPVSSAFWFSSLTGKPEAGMMKRTGALMAHTLPIRTCCCPAVSLAVEQPRAIAET